MPRHAAAGFNSHATVKLAHLTTTKGQEKVTDSVYHTLTHILAHSLTHSPLRWLTEAVSSSPLVESRQPGTEVAGGEMDAQTCMRSGTCKYIHMNVYISERSNGQQRSLVQ